MPLGAQEDLSRSAAISSLQCHAEKKALADLLLRRCSSLTVRVNLKMCADCQAFLKHAAVLLCRPIEVLEPSRRHVFREDGAVKPGTAVRGEHSVPSNPRRDRTTA